MSDLEKRVESLEKKLRTSRYLTMLLGMIIAAGGLIAAVESPGKIVCKELVLVDNQGKMRVHMATNDESKGFEDGTGLTVYSADGKYLTGIGQSSMGWGMLVADNKGMPKTGVGISSFGTGFAILDNEGKLKAKLAEDADSLGLWVYRPGQIPSTFAGSWPGGEGVDVFDVNGKPRVGIGMTPTEDYGLGVFSPEGNWLFAVGLIKDQLDPTLLVIDAKGKTMFAVPKGATLPKTPQ